MGNLTGPLFGLDQLPGGGAGTNFDRVPVVQVRHHCFPCTSAGLGVPPVSAPKLGSSAFFLSPSRAQAPYPEPTAMDAATDFNARAAASGDWQSYASRYQARTLAAGARLPLRGTRACLMRADAQRKRV